jgi:hypothetical protein
MTAAVCGNSKIALPLAQGLAKENPEDTIIHDVVLPLTQCFLALSAGHPREALDDAAPSIGYTAIVPAAYAQGLAALGLHDSGGAINAFKLATQYPGAPLVAGFSVPFYAESQLGLARAYVMAGDRADAKQAYQAFFTTWKNADPDLQMLVAAKKEYASL